MKRLVAFEFTTFTERQIPMQFGLDFPTYENKILEDGGIDNSIYKPPFTIEQPSDNMEWRLQDENYHFSHIL